MVNIILAARGRITTYFLQDIGRGFPHNGVDQGHGTSTAWELQIVAPADGVVTAVGQEGSYGYRIIITHDDGSTSLLAHHAAQFVTVGQRVTRGQHIATMGDSGTKYVHSHQEYRDAAGNQLDPLAYLASTTASVSIDTAINSITTEEDDDMKIQIIQPYGLPDRGVIGDIAYAFPNEGQLAHFKNVWRGKVSNIDEVTVVGDKNMSEKARRDVFKLLIEMHKSK